MRIGIRATRPHGDRGAKPREISGLRSRWTPPLSLQLAMAQGNRVHLLAVDNQKRPEKSVPSSNKMEQSQHTPIPACSVETTTRPKNQELSRTVDPRSGKVVGMNTEHVLGALENIPQAVNQRLGA